jgi:hypothetical protein
VAGARDRDRQYLQTSSADCTGGEAGEDNGETANVYICNGSYHSLSVLDRDAVALI